MIFGSGQSSMTRGGLGPIGIDLSPRSVRLAQVQWNSGTPVLYACASSPLPANVLLEGENYAQEVGQLVAQMIREGDFRGRKVVPCLPSEMLQCKNIRMPSMPVNEIASAVQWEARERFNFKSGQAISTQFIQAGEVRQGEEIRQEVIMLATREAFVEALVEALVENKLEPLAVDAVPTALARCMNDPNRMEETRVLLDLGYSSCKVLIVNDDRVRFFSRAWS